MSKELKLWAVRPFELIFHAETHYRSGTDYDKRLALISFDNSIEVSITTYLSLNPIQRSNRVYKKDDVNIWMNNYHTKIDFFVEEIKNRGLPEYKEKADIVWYHSQRNDQYHGEGAGVPSNDTLDGIRQVAIWVFSVLFETVDVETRLNSEISEGEITMLPIPESYVVPEEQKIRQEHISALVIATILGNWDENNEDDKELIRRLVDGF